MRSVLRESLTDSSPDVRLTAARTLAVISHDAPDVIDDIGELLASIEALRDKSPLADDAIDEAAAIVRATTDQGGKA